jgi:hypothetical protein
MEVLEMLGYLLVGIGLGILLHRAIMAFVLARAPDNLCAYCEWMGRKNGPSKKDRPL